MLRLNTILSDKAAWPEFGCRKAWCHCMSLPFFQRYPVSPLSHQFTLRISPSRDRNLGAGANTSTFSNLGIFNNQTCASAKFLSIDGWIDSLKHRYHISGVVNPTNVAICEILCFIAAWLTGYNTLLHLLAPIPIQSLRGAMHPPIVISWIRRWLLRHFLVVDPC